MSKGKIDYLTVPLELLTLKDLTDATGIAKAAEVLETSARAIYTQRNTGRIGVDRLQKLIDFIKSDPEHEAHCRQRLFLLRKMQDESEPAAA